MIKAERKHKSKIIDILALSFTENQSVNYIIAHKNNPKEIRALMDYSFEQCSIFGDIYLSDDKHACALVLYPHKKRFSLKASWLDINLIFNAIGLWRIFKVLNRESAIKKLQPKRRMAYLWFIGVTPAAQHTGIGSRLLEDILALKKKENLPVFLETSTLTNLPWYQRFGFEIYNKLSIGYTLYFLKNDKIQETTC